MNTATYGQGSPLPTNTTNLSVFPPQPDLSGLLMMIFFTAVSWLMNFINAGEIDTVVVLLKDIAQLAAACITLYIGYITIRKHRRDKFYCRNHDEGGPAANCTGQCDACARSDSAVNLPPD